MYPLDPHARCAIGTDLAALHDRLQKDSPTLFDAHDVCAEVLHQCELRSVHSSSREYCFPRLILFCDPDKTRGGGSGSAVNIVSHAIQTLDDLEADPTVSFTVTMYISRLMRDLQNVFGDLATLCTT